MSRMDQFVTFVSLVNATPTLSHGISVDEVSLDWQFSSGLVSSTPNTTTLSQKN